MTTSEQQCERDIAVDGYAVPYLNAYPYKDSETLWHLYLNRLGATAHGLDVDEAELRRWLPFIADCMAVAAGFTAHGEHGRPQNPHGVALRQISTAYTEAPDDHQ